MSDAARRDQRPWDIALVTMFAIGSIFVLLPSLFYPGLIGSHAVLYTNAARTMVIGSDPWLVGPPIFAGPPTMLLSFIPFVAFPDLLLRASWIAIDIVVAIWAIRRLGLPAYWLAFPPLVQTIVLGHPEVLVLGLIVAGRNLSGLALLVKPYAIFPLLGEGRWWAIGIAAGLVVITAPFLQWPRFFVEIPEIVATIVRQWNGDSVFGDPIPMAIGIVALLSLGPRRALWLAVPVLWPFAQPNYKVMTMPMVSPLLALFWAIPVPGLTLTGIIVLATAVAVNRWRPLPAWLQMGVREPMTRQEESDQRARTTVTVPQGQAGAA